MKRQDAGGCDRLGMTSGPFVGKVVWITGASSGIGRSLAIACAAAGARLILSGRQSHALDKVARECQPAEVAVVPFDLADLAGIPERVAEALACFGGVDIMIHNAGLAMRDRVVNTSREVHERILHINYLGPALLTQALLPSMFERGGGHFVVVSSALGKFGGPLLAAYAAAKHALHGFFESLRAEEHDRGIVVTMVIPGFVKTDITAHALTGSGDSFGRVLPIYHNAMSADECARQMLPAIACGRQEVLIGGSDIWMVHLKRWLPRLLALVIRSHPVRLRNRLLAWI
jgi:dehydrogenase/reductase SDR family protein 7B